MNSNLCSRSHRCLWLGLGFLTLLVSPAVVQAAMKPLVIQGTLRYNRGSSKSFVWHLKISNKTGLCIGRSKDKDGTATFNGYYNRRTGKFLLRKTYVNRKRGTRSFYYKGTIRSGLAKGTAHFKSYKGSSYARWRGSIRRNVGAPPSLGRGRPGIQSNPPPTRKYGLRGRRSPRNNGLRGFGGRDFGQGGGYGYRGQGRSGQGYDSNNPFGVPDQVRPVRPRYHGRYGRGGSGYRARAVAKRFVFRGRLRYKNGAPSKSFSWTLRYYPRTGLCFGNVTDVDGSATFNGTFNRHTGFIFLTKTYIDRRSGTRTFYYRGRIASTGAWGTAHFSSYYGRSYGRWTAKLLWSSNRSPRSHRNRRRIPSFRGSKRLRFSGRLTYTNGAGSKRFRWLLRYYPHTGICKGLVRDKDGTASFNGTFNQQTGEFFLTKTYIYRRTGTRTFYYRGRITRRGARGTAHLNSYYGRRYGRWSASIRR